MNEKMRYRSFELDEAEGFILLGRRREKGFPLNLGTARRRGRSLARMHPARGHLGARAVSCDPPRDNKASTTTATQCCSPHLRVADRSRAQHRRMPSQRAHNSASTNSITSSTTCGSYVHGSAGRSRSPTQKRAPPALSNPTPSGKTPDGRPCPPRGWLPQPFRAPPRPTSTAAAYPLKDHSTESLLMQISR
eukprot:COSAG02_NODE_9870_length_2088_cov_40.620533_1_plen_192_part_00